MRLLVVFAALVCAGAASELSRARPELDTAWKEFKGKHKKTYKTTTEEATRRNNWETNRNSIDAHNKEAAAGKRTYYMQENHMSDWSADEKKKLLGRVPKSRSLTNRIKADLSDLERQSVPATVDLRTNPCMTPIQNQGICGSCWAFGSTAATEFRLCRKLGGTKAIKLSEQHLVDCSVYNKGCNGGDERLAWTYVQNTKGQVSANDYPYVSGADGLKQFCEYFPSQAVAAVKGYVDYLPRTNLTAIQWLIANQGTVTASLHVVDSFFYVGGDVTFRSQYNTSSCSGVYSETTCSSDGSTANHVVALVGYGTLNGIPYWIVRNSWNTSWGVNGYAFIRRGVNTCNIESRVTYPLL